MCRDAEVWLEGAYPELYCRWREAYLRSSPRRQEDDQQQQAGQLCRICHLRPNTGLHYGILACEADKQFLKRTFHEQQLYRKCPLACPPRTRGWCQYCRLEAALVIGINLKMIRLGERSIKSRKKVPSPDLVKQEPASNETSTGDSAVTFTADSALASTAASSMTFTMASAFMPVHRVQDPRGPGYTPPYCSEQERAGQYGNMHQEPQFVPWPVYYPVPSYHYPEPAYSGVWQPSPPAPWLHHHQDLLTPIPSSPSPPLVMYHEDATNYRSAEGDQSVPLDLSSASSSSSFSSSSGPSSRPSSAGSSASARSSPRSMRNTQEIGTSFNKLSINSAVLQEALSHVAANMTSGSLANLSHVSDVLAEH